MTEAETKAYNQGISDAADVVDKVRRTPAKGKIDIVSMTVLNILAEISINIRRGAK